MVACSTLSIDHSTHQHNPSQVFCGMPLGTEQRWHLRCLRKCQLQEIFVQIRQWTCVWLNKLYFLLVLFDHQDPDSISYSNPGIQISTCLNVITHYFCLKNLPVAHFHQFAIDRHRQCRCWHVNNEYLVIPYRFQLLFSYIEENLSKLVVRCRSFLHLNT